MTSLLPSNGKDAILNTWRKERALRPPPPLHSASTNSKEVKKEISSVKNTSSLTTFHFPGPFIFSLVHGAFQIVQGFDFPRKSEKTFLPPIRL